MAPRRPRRSASARLAADESRPAAAAINEGEIAEITSFEVSSGVSAEVHEVMAAHKRELFESASGGVANVEECDVVCARTRISKGF